MRNFLQDLRYGIRMMAKRPGFTLIAALTLALGIGANTAIFSAVNAVLLKPLPFPESQQLVDLAETFKPNGYGSVSVPTLEDWKSQNNVFAGISAYSFTSFNIEGGDGAERVPGMNVNANYFDVLGIKPALGRTFLPGEDVAGRERVLVLGDDLWRRNFAANPDIVNQDIVVNGHKYTVVGVMPREMSSLYRTVQMWSPLVFSAKDRAERGDHKYLVIGRIKSGVTLEQARQQMDAIAQRLEEQYKNGRGVRLLRIEELWVANVRSTLVMLMIAVGFVLLIACTNVKNYGLLTQPVPEMYALYSAKDFWPDMRWNMRLLVRSTRDDNLAAAVHREVAAVDPGQALYGVQSMTVVIENTVREKTLNTTLLASFAAVSLLLAVIGVYGVMSYTVAQHTREIGIRIALGAQRRSILKLVVGRGLVLVGAGVVIGVLASFGLTRFIENMLFGITPTDPLTFVVIVALLGFVALLACLVPAQRAMRVDPIVVFVTSDPFYFRTRFRTG